MEMQDKEFDKLFSSKLDDFEMEPSEKVWSAIAGELNSSKQKKSAMLPFLGIAASIIILIAAGILFIPQKAKVTVKQPDRHQTAKIIKPEYADNNPAKTSLIAREDKKAVTKSSPVYQLKQPRNIKENNIRAYTPTVKQDVKKEETLKVINQPLLAAVPQNSYDVVKPAADTARTLAAISTHDKPAISVITVPNNVPVEKKRRIRSFGDVLNVVIAAVDKRKDKILQFSNTDGDEATITGVNLEVVKIKKEDK